MKRALIFLVCLMTALPGFGVDFGFLFDNTTGLIAGVNDPGFEGTPYTKNVTALQKDRLSAWLSSPLSKEAWFRMEAHGTVGTESKSSLLYQPGVSPYILAYDYDLDELVFGGEYPVRGTIDSGLFGFRIGRFAVSDFTGDVLGITGDGVSFTLRNSYAEWTFEAVYTGLTMKKSFPVLLTRADSADYNNDDRYLAPPRAVIHLGLDFPQLFLDQSLSFSVIAQDDLRNLTVPSDPSAQGLYGYDLIAEGTDTESPELGGTLDSYYLGIGLSGPITPSLFYETALYCQTGYTLSYMAEGDDAGTYKYQPMLGFLATLSLDYYIEKTYYTSAHFGFLMGTGDADYANILEDNSVGLAQLFLPLATAGNEFVFRPGVTNLGRFDLGGSIKPLKKTGIEILENTQLFTNLIFFFRPTTGAINETGIDPNKEGLYLGTEWNLGLSFRFFSDLGLSIKGGLFAPDGGAFEAEPDRSPQIRGRLEAVCSISL